MKKWFEKLENINFTTRNVPWLLLLIAGLTYGLFFWQRGFYWDEFPWAWTYYRLGPDMLTKTFTTSRPFWGMIYQLTLPVIGPNPWIWQLLALVLRWLTAVLFWLILCNIWPKYTKPIFLASLFFLVYPGLGQHFIAMMYSHFYIVLNCYLLSIYLSLLAIQNDKRRWLLFGVSYVFAFINLITMEYFYFLEFARVVLLWQILSGTMRERIKKAALYFLPYFIIFVGVTFWRTFFFTYQNASYHYVILDAIKENFVGGVLLLLKNIGLSFWRTIFVVWFYPMFRIGMTGLGPLTLILMFTLFFSIVLIVGIFLFKFDAGGGDRRFFNQAGFVGLVLWVFSGGSVWIIGIVPQLNFSLDRFMLPFMLGSSLILACLITLVKNQRVQITLVALLVGFAFSRHFTLEEIYRSDWITQQDFFEQMTLRIPGFEDGTILLSNDLPVTYYSDNSLTGPLNWIYSPPGEMDLILYFASIRVGKTLPSVEPGLYHELYYIGPTFYGNTTNLLVIDYEPPGCFRVIDPEVEANNRLLPPALRDVARYSNQSVIKFEKRYELPRQLYGAGEHDWCYYFNLAELARQKGDWDEVVALANPAFALNDTPNDPVERFVFIEGYAHNGDWEKAVKLSKTSYKVSKNYVAPMLCKLWNRIERETPETQQQSEAVANMLVEFGCQQE